MSVAVPPSELITLFDFANNFVAARVLIAASKLGILTILAEQPATIDEMVKRTKTNKHGMQALLSALNSLDLVHCEEGQYFLRADYVDVIRSHGNLFDTAVEHVYHLWQCFSDLETAITHGGCSVGLAEDSSLDFESAAAAIASAYIQHTRKAASLHWVIPFAGVKQVLAVGYQACITCMPIAQDHPEIELTFCESDNANKVLKPYAKREHLVERVKFINSNFAADYTIKSDINYDMVLLVNELRMHNVEEDQNLLNALAAKVAPGGQLVILEIVKQGDNEIDEHGFIDLATVATTQNGGLPQNKDIVSWLQTIGFGKIEQRIVDEQMLYVAHRGTARI